MVLGDLNFNEAVCLQVEELSHLTLCKEHTFDYSVTMLKGVAGKYDLALLWLSYEARSETIEKEKVVSRVYGWEHGWSLDSDDLEQVLICEECCYYELSHSAQYNVALSHCQGVKFEVLTES